MMPMNLRTALASFLFFLLLQLEIKKKDDKKKRNLFPYYSEHYNLFIGL